MGLVLACSGGSYWILSGFIKSTDHSSVHVHIYIYIRICTCVHNMHVLHVVFPLRVGGIVFAPA